MARDIRRPHTQTNWSELQINNSVHILACVATGHLHTAAMPWKVCCKQEPRMLEFMTDPWVLFFTDNSLCNLPLWILHKLVKICYCNTNENVFSRAQKHSEVMFKNIPMYQGTMQWFLQLLWACNFCKKRQCRLYSYPRVAAVFDSTSNHFLYSKYMHIC